MNKSPTALPTPLSVSLALAALLAGCGTPPATPGNVAPTQPVTLAPKVDLSRYMGDWFVIANIPTSVEANAYNSKESYRLDGPDKIAISFTFNEGGYTGPLKTLNSTGSVPDKTNNAVWGVQFIWPMKADYRIAYVSTNYQQVVVAREKRDYVWIMARTPTVSDADYQRLVGVVRKEGYDTSKLRRVPQASGK